MCLVRYLWSFIFLVSSPCLFGDIGIHITLPVCIPSWWLFNDNILPQYVISIILGGGGVSFIIFPLVHPNLCFLLVLWLCRFCSGGVPIRIILRSVYILGLHGLSYCFTLNALPESHISL